MQSQVQKIIRIAISAALMSGVLGILPMHFASAQEITGSSKWAVTDTLGRVVSEEDLKGWHETLKDYGPIGEGCFHTSYPRLNWDKVACGPKRKFDPRRYVLPPHPATSSKLSAAGLPVLQTAGDGTDYVARTAANTIFAEGGLSSKGVTSESNTSLPGSMPGSNSYTLQLNSNFSCSSNYTGPESGNCVTGLPTANSACSAFGYTSCAVWLQFLYESDGDSSGDAYFYMQNWVYPSLADYKSRGCPRGWEIAGTSSQPACLLNSSMQAPPVVPVTQLSTIMLAGSAKAGGSDTVALYINSDAGSVSQSDSGVVHLANWWQATEFNVVGNGGGSQAQFNKGASITVHLVAKDGSTTIPGANKLGWTAESNNLTLGTSITGGGGTNPYIQFGESD